MNKVHVKTGDKVIILSGRDKGKEGKVLEVSPSEGKVIVEGCNIATKHAKPRKMGEQGGLLKVETAIYASKVMLVCPKCGKPKAPPSPSPRLRQKAPLQSLRRDFLSEEEKT